MGNMHILYVKHMSAGKNEYQAMYHNDTNLNRLFYFFQAAKYMQTDYKHNCFSVVVESHNWRLLMPCHPML